MVKYVGNSLNTKFDSHAFQREVEGYHKSTKSRNKQFEEVFGELSRNVKKKGGILREAMKILSSPDKFLSDIRKKYSSAKQKYPK